MSVKPSTYPGRETPSPYPQSSSLASETQQPVGSTGSGWGAQHSLMTSPGDFPSSQLGPGNVQATTPTPGTAAVPYKEAMKILGGIQIVIGAMHPGFGVLMPLLKSSLGQAWGFGSISFIAGYPFWGGLCFIISGAVTIAAFQELSSSLLRSSLGVNVLSCIFCITGVNLLAVDLCITVLHQKDYWTSVYGKGISATVMFFSLVELCIASGTAHVATQAIRSLNRSTQPIPTDLVTPRPPRSDSHSSDTRRD